MFKYQWTELITPTFMQWLSERAGADVSTEPPLVHEALVSIFRSTGGLAVAETEYDEAEKTALAMQLLSDALDRYVSQLNFVRPEPGHYLEEVEERAYDQEITTVPETNLNTATERALEALPAIGPELARRMVLERTTRGPYQSLEDLEARVDGIGQQAVRVLANAVDVAPPLPDALQWPAQAGLEDRFQVCLTLFSGDDPLDKLARLLDAVASTVAAAPHPATIGRHLRSNAGAALGTTEVEWIGVLANHDYYRRLPDLLSSATASLRVAMFHAAFGQEDHPTRALLDELIAASDRSVTVRVLLDQDRESDPYKSTVINSPAREYLLAHGVDCRFDTEERLLHSKFIVIDEQTCIVGSHNWSAGSYFQFDDVGLVIRSATFGQRMAERFDQLWPA